MKDIASKKYFKENEELATKWRNKMIRHLKIRGKEWVKNGNLTVQEKSIHIGKNNPEFHKN
jgi:hypothetical protein